MSFSMDADLAAGTKVEKRAGHVPIRQPPGTVLKHLCSELQVTAYNRALTPVDGVQGCVGFCSNHRNCTPNSHLYTNGDWFTGRWKHVTLVFFRHPRSRAPSILDQARTAGKCIYADLMRQASWVKPVLLASVSTPAQPLDASKHHLYIPYTKEQTSKLRNTIASGLNCKVASES